MNKLYDLYAYCSDVAVLKVVLVTQFSSYDTRNTPCNPFNNFFHGKWLCPTLTHY